MFGSSGGNAAKKVGFSSGLLIHTDEMDSLDGEGRADLKRPVLMFYP
jgi:hypothetical protein